MPRLVEPAPDERPHRIASSRSTACTPLTPLTICVTCRSTTTLASASACVALEPELALHQIEHRRHRVLGREIEILVEAERDPRVARCARSASAARGRSSSSVSCARSSGHSIAVPETSPSPCARVAVARREERAVDRDRQIERRAGDEQLAVDVAAASAAAGRSSGCRAPAAACRSRRGTARARRVLPRSSVAVSPSSRQTKRLAVRERHAPVARRHLVDRDDERLAGARAAHLDRAGQRVAVVQLRVALDELGVRVPVPAARSATGSAPSRRDRRSAPAAARDEK